MRDPYLKYLEEEHEIGKKYLKVHEYLRNDPGGCGVLTKDRLYNEIYNITEWAEHYPRL